MNKVTPILTSFIIACCANTVQALEFDGKAKIEIKCAVELLGGREALHFAVIPASDLKRFKQQLPGSKTTIPQSKKMQVIYKVNECVPAQQSFSKEKWKVLDNNTLR